MSESEPPDERRDGQSSQPDVSFDELAFSPSSTDQTESIQRLRAENQRLRRQYSRARRVGYDRTAIGLGAVGVIAVGAAVVFSSVREVLLVVGSFGLFAAVLTRYLTPELFLPIDVAEGIYDSVDDTRSSLVAELDLIGDPQYVPIDRGTVRLFVPQRPDGTLPDSEELRSTLVVPTDDDRRGVAFTPSGQTLFREFERTLTGSLGETPRAVATVLAEGTSEGLELVDGTDVEVDSATGRVTMRFAGVPFGAADRLDHPVVSFVGTGLANGLDTPVSIADARPDDDAGAVVTFTYDSAVEPDVGVSEESSEERDADA